MRILEERRKRLTGSLQQKRGKYYVVLNSKNKDGKRKQEWISTGYKVEGNKRNAQIFMQDLLYNRRNDTTYSTDKLFSDFLLEWLQGIKMLVQESTFESYSLAVKKHIYPYFDDLKIKLNRLEPRNIQNYYQCLADKGLSANTILKHHANIHKCLNSAVRQNLIAYNPSDRVELPKKKKYVANYYTENELVKLLELSLEDPIYPAIFLTVFYGLRRSEILGLRWKDIDFENDKITIQHTIVKYSSIIAKDSTKNQSSMRSLPLVPKVKSFLRELQEKQQKNAEIFGKGYKVSPYICVHPHGEPFKPDYLSTHFKILLRNLNLRSIRFHDLRHSAATQLLNNRFSMKEIQDWLGHSDIATTANIYAHVDFRAKENMAYSLEKKLLEQS